MLTIESLLAAGYKAYGKSGAARFKNADDLYQKCIRDDKGKKYYITIYMYDWRETVLPYRKINFMPEVQFRDPSDKCPTIDVTYFDDKNTTVESLESFFDSLWVWHGSNYYEEC